MFIGEVIAFFFGKGVNEEGLTLYWKKKKK